MPEPTPDKNSIKKMKTVLFDALAKTTQHSAELTLYGLAAGALALAVGTGTPLGILSALAGGVGANGLYDILKKVAESGKPSSDEVDQQLDRMANQLLVQNSLVQAEDQIAFGNLIKSLGLLQQDVDRSGVSILTAISRHSNEFGYLFHVLRNDLAKIDQRISQIIATQAEQATRGQVESLHWQLAEFLNTLPGLLSQKPSLERTGMKLVNVPEFPPYFLPRPSALVAMKQLFLAPEKQATRNAGKSHPVVLYGMGGIGKSVMAAALARDEQVRQAFSDGLLWITLGESPPLTARLYDLCIALGAVPPQPFVDVEAGRVYLCNVLANKACLIILDNVWQAEDALAFIGLGQFCDLLITTRDSELVPALAAYSYNLETLSSDEALQLMAGWFVPEDAAESEKQAVLNQVQKGWPFTALEVAKECGYLPLALALCAAQVKGGTPWRDLLDALREADLAFFDHPHGSILKSIKVSVDNLRKINPTYAQCYLKMAVFPANMPVPEAAILILWQQSNQLAGRHTRQLIKLLASKALIRVTGTQPDRWIQFHDLQHAFLRQSSADLPSLHQDMINGYRKQCAFGWHSGPNDGYFFEHLVYHLTALGAVDELKSLFTNQDWMHARVKYSGYAGYVADLMAAWNLVAADFASQSGGDAEVITHSLRYVLIRSSIHDISRNHIPELVTQAVNLKYWTIQQAWGIASNLTGAAEKGRMLVALFETGQLNEKDSANLRVELIKLITTIEDQAVKGNLISSSAPFLEDDSLRACFELARTIEAGENQFAALIGLIPYLSGVSRQLAVKLSLEILSDLEASREKKLEWLKVLLPELEPPDLQPALSYFSELIGETEQSSSEILENIQWWLSLLPFCPLPMQHSILAQNINLTLAHSDRVLRILALARLIPACAPYDQHRLLANCVDALKGIHEPWDYAKVAAALAPLLGEEERTQVMNHALDEVLTIKEDWARAKALDFILAGLEGDSRALALQGGIAAANAIQNPWGQAERLRALLPYLAEKENLEKQAALETALKIEPDMPKITALGFLAPQLDGDLLSKLVDQALGISDFQKRTDLLRLLAPVLGEKKAIIDLAKSIGIALDIGDHPYRASALIRLSLWLEGESRLKYLRQAVQTALSIVGKSERADVFRLVSKSLTLKPDAALAGELLDGCIDGAATIGIKAQLLATLAPFVDENTRYASLSTCIAEVFSNKKQLPEKFPQILEAEAVEQLLLLAPFLNRELVNQVLAGLNEFAVPNKVLKVRLALAHQLSDAERSTLLKQLITSAEIDQNLKQEGLRSLFPLLNRRQLTRIFHRIARQPSFVDQLDIPALMGFFPEGVEKQQVLELCLRRARNKPGISSAASLIPWMAEEERGKAAVDYLEEVRKLPLAYERVYWSVFLYPFLSDGAAKTDVLWQCIQDFLSTEDLEAKLNIVEELSPLLLGEHLRRVFDEVLLMKDLSAKSQLLSLLIPQLGRVELGMLVNDSSIQLEYWEQFLAALSYYKDAEVDLGVRQKFISWLLPYLKQKNDLDRWMVLQICTNRQFILMLGLMEPNVLAFARLIYEICWCWKWV